VTKCLAEIDYRGLSEEGIYRKAGSPLCLISLSALFSEQTTLESIGPKVAVEQLCEKFEDRGNSNQDIDLSSIQDPNVITGCIKLFFRSVI